MILQLTFKTPDVLDDAINEQVPDDPGQHKHAEHAAEKFIEYGEYVTIKIDTSTGKAWVLEVG